MADTIIKSLKVVSGKDDGSTAQVAENEESSLEASVIMPADKVPPAPGQMEQKFLAASNNEYSSEPSEITEP